MIIRTLRALALIALLAPATAFGQQLFTFVEEDGPVGVAAPSTVGLAGDMGPEIEPIAIDVDLDLLRSRPTAITLPSVAGGPDTVLHLMHFEDRGNGNVLWTGSPLGLRWEDALFTIHDGSAVGRFHVSDGTHYVLVSNPSGSFLSLTGHPPGDWCAGMRQGQSGLEERRLLDREATRAAVPQYLRDAPAPPPEAVAESVEAAIVSAARAGDSSRRLDVVFVVTPSAAERMRRPTEKHVYIEDGILIEDGGIGIEATVQSMADYANQVFRNNWLGTRVNIVATELSRNLQMDFSPLPSYLQLLWQGGAWQPYRQKHDADLVHVLNYGFQAAFARVNHQGGICGLANIYLSGMSVSDMANDAFGYSDLACGPVPGSSAPADIAFWPAVFIHEIGHNLGINHPRQIPHYEEDSSRYPWAYGVYVNPQLDSNPYRAFESWVWSPDHPPHVRWEPSKTDEGNTGAYTIMSYRPGKHWVALPFFSGGDWPDWGVGEHGLRSEDVSARWVNGLYGKHDAALAINYTSRELSRLNDHDFDIPWQPENIRAHAQVSGDDLIVVLRWDDVSDNELGFTAYGEYMHRENGILSAKEFQSVDLPADTEIATLARLDWNGEENLIFWVEARGREAFTLDGEEYHPASDFLFIEPRDVVVRCSPSGSLPELSLVSGEMGWDAFEAGPVYDPEVWTVKIALADSSAFNISGEPHCIEKLKYSVEENDGSTWTLLESSEEEVPWDPFGQNTDTAVYTIQEGDTIRSMADAMGIQYFDVEGNLVTGSGSGNRFRVIVTLENSAGSASSSIEALYYQDTDVE